MNQQTKMSNDITPPEGTNQEPEVEVEETTTEEETETETPDDTEDVETLKEKLAKAEQAKRELTVRAKKAEDALKGAPKSTQTTTSPLSNEQIETTVLKAQGMDIDSINYLAKLAKVNGTGLIEAQSDELFLNYKAKKEADAKAQKAKLGASRGSGTIKKEKDLTTPGLTEEERKEIWKSRQR